MEVLAWGGACTTVTLSSSEAPFTNATHLYLFSVYSLCACKWRSIQILSSKDKHACVNDTAVVSSNSVCKKGGHTCGQANAGILTLTQKTTQLTF